jgi:ABC-type glutathione transport system ATPase component
VNVLELDALAVDLRVEGRLRRVIHEVTLNVAESQAVGLVGESGAGKSMTSRAVMRLLPAGAMIRGDIRFQGRSVPAMDAGQLRAFRLRDVAMIFQDPRAHINPVRTIGDFLTEALLERGESRRRAD